MMPIADDSTTISDLRSEVRRFVDERDWGRFHNPKDLSISLCIEAAELLEEFQWLSPEEVEQTRRQPEALARVAFELADVLIYGLSLANALELDVATTVRKKLEAAALKYPAARFRGRFRLNP